MPIPTIGSVNPVVLLYAIPINGPNEIWFFGGGIFCVGPWPLTVIPPILFSSIYA